MSKVQAWRLKASFQRAIARLPPAVGDPFYHWLQILRGLKPALAPHLMFVNRMEDLMGPAFHWQGVHAVELGSGWYPTTPLLLACRAIGHLHTFDSNHHYSHSRVRAAAKGVLAHQPCCETAHVTASSGRLPPAVTYHPRADLATTTLPAKSIGLAFSRLVLEHVPPETITRIHESAHSWLNDDGRWIHRISSCDHRSFTNPHLSSVDFLRFSATEWERLAGNRFAYHNRLRRCQYRELFERSGWKIVFQQEDDISEEKRAALTKVTLHEDYAQFPAEELLAGSLWFVLEKG